MRLGVEGASWFHGLKGDKLSEIDTFAGLLSYYRASAVGRSSIIASTRLGLKPSGYRFEIAGHEPRQSGILVAGPGLSLEKQMVRLRQRNLGDVAIPGLAQRPFDRRPGLAGGGHWRPAPRRTARPGR